MQPLAADDPRQVGEYRLLRRLGAGGMGRVYLGRTPGGRTVAVKVVRHELTENPEFRARFRQEVSAARRVGGAWTAPVLDADTEGEHLWVATGYIAGPSLTAAVQEFGPLPEPAVRTLGVSLAEALSHVHGLGLVHRDVKPSNVLLTLDGPRLIDFGITRALDATTGLTRSGQIFGSPGFMSPEQANGLPAGPASDVFSLGAVLAYAATGTMPFGSGVSAPVLLYRVLHEEPDLSGLTGPLHSLVRDCLAKDPSARPAPGRLREQLDGDEAATARPGHGDWLPGPLAAAVGRSAVQLLDLEGEPKAGTPEPKASEPASAGELEAGAREASEPASAGEAEGGAPEASEPASAGEAETGAPEAGKPRASEQQTSEPQAAKPQTSEPETAKPQTSEPETAKPQTSEPETAKPQTSEPETGEGSAAMGADVGDEAAAPVTESAAGSRAPAGGPVVATYGAPDVPAVPGAGAVPGFGPAALPGFGPAGGGPAGPADGGPLGPVVPLGPYTPAPVPAPPLPDHAPRPQRPRGRRRYVALAALLAGVLVVGGGYLLFEQLRKDQRDDGAKTPGRSTPSGGGTTPAPASKTPKATGSSDPDDDSPTPGAGSGAGIIPAKFLGTWVGESKDADGGVTTVTLTLVQSAPSQEKSRIRVETPKSGTWCEGAWTLTDADQGKVTYASRVTGSSPDEKCVVGDVTYPLVRTLEDGGLLYTMDLTNPGSFMTLRRKG
ncbi:protein kinase [Streptomyces sp. NPDC101191]|uniref:protein kinase domain-containing protein n=1 Tax=Streptomyces sp. NPDC101191 TaxID=3366126 RepID=UPI00381DBFED